MNEKAHISERLHRALIHDLRGLLSPIYTISQGRALFGPPDLNEAAEEYQMILQASTQMKELLNSWDLAFAQRDQAIPQPVDVLAAVSAAGNSLNDMIPEESCPQIKLPTQLPSCIGLEPLLRQAFADIFRFLAGLGTAHSKIAITGTASENQAIYVVSISGVRCSKGEVADYLHNSAEPSRYVYALLGARLMLERQEAQLEMSSHEQTGVIVRVTIPC